MRVALALLLITPTAAWPAEPTPEAELAAAFGEKYFNRDAFKGLRGIYAKYVEAKHADDIRAGLGDRASTIEAFLNDNAELKETLLAALNPEVDDVAAAFRVLGKLHEAAPEQVKAFPQLTVAMCVVWDKPRAIYDYRGHALRTRSPLPVDPRTIGPVENFQYLTSQDASITNVLQALPWEFLVHVVNHQTPLDEREWAVQTYGKKRAGIGKIYPTVQYDQQMLRTEMANGPGKGECRLTGQDYTLPNIRKFGGVCAMQADFASRVAKSLAIPAEYVRGESNTGGRHAWVMWTEIQSATKDKLNFQLLSEGRYFGDQYYVGTFADPQSGKEYTDRDLERRLTALGNKPLPSRQADLLMRIYPIVAEQKGHAPKQAMGYIKRVFEVDPQCERAWLKLAELSKDRSLIDPPDAVNNANRAFREFSNFPDFCWALFDPLLTHQNDLIQRARVYERAVVRFEELGRPDLACECRIRLSEYQVAAKEYRKAADGLAQTIGKFPSEGRYVPKMMTKMIEICTHKDYREGVKKLTQFYMKLLPQVPKTRGDEVSDYCVKLHKQALGFLKANKQEKEAAWVEQQLAQLTRGRR